MPFAVGFRRTQHRSAVLGTIRYGHVRYRIPVCIESNAFNSLRWLRLFDNDELANGHRRSGEECTRKRDCNDSTHH